VIDHKFQTVLDTLIHPVLPPTSSSPPANISEPQIKIKEEIDHNIKDNMNIKQSDITSINCLHTSINNSKPIGAIDISESKCTTTVILVDNNIASTLVPHSDTREETATYCHKNGMTIVHDNANKKNGTTPFIIDTTKNQHTDGNTHPHDGREKSIIDNTYLKSGSTTDVSASDNKGDYNNNSQYHSTGSYKNTFRKNRMGSKTDTPPTNDHIYATGLNNISNNTSESCSTITITAINDDSIDSTMQRKVCSDTYIFDKEE